MFLLSKHVCLTCGFNKLMMMVMTMLCMLMQVTGNETTLEVDGLTPFTNYSYRVWACTVAGCTVSNSSEITTLTSSMSCRFHSLLV